MTAKSMTKPLTPASQDLRKQNEERNRDCFMLIRKVCWLKAENEALKVQIVRLMRSTPLQPRMRRTE